jgi:hypothetical protein
MEKAEIEKKTIRAIYLDSASAIAMDIQIEPTLEAFCAQLNCRSIQAVFPFESKNVLFVDEEGMYREHRFGLSLSPNAEDLEHFGNGLIVGLDGDREVDCSLSLFFDVIPRVKFWRIELDSALVPIGKG